MAGPDRRFQRLWGRGYKPFGGSFELPLAPLTVVFGRNGSGKSALVRLPALLVEAQRISPGDRPGLPAQARGMSFGTTLQDFRHGRVADEFDLGFELSDGLRVEWTIARAQGSSVVASVQEVRGWTLTTAGQVQTPDAKDVFSRLIPLTSTSQPSAAGAGLWPIPTVAHLIASRGLPRELAVPVPPNLPSDVGSRGQHTLQVLAGFHAQGRDLTLLQEWAGRCLNVELDVRDVQGIERSVAVQCRPKGRGTWSMPADLGTGVGHALPLLVQCGVVTLAQPGEQVPSMIVCEEPEAHLHPRAQADVADVLILAAQTGRTTCLVETHSETFILRLRRRLAEGLLRPDEVAFCWVDDEGSVTRTILLSANDEGDIEGWPTGWFGAALDETNALLRALVG